MLRRSLLLAPAALRKPAASPLVVTLPVAGRTRRRCEGEAYDPASNLTCEYEGAVLVIRYKDRTLEFDDAGVTRLLDAFENFASWRNEPGEKQR